MLPLSSYASEQMASQPPNAENQPAVIKYADQSFADGIALLQRIKTVAQIYEENLKKRNADIGFNLFELISDQYYRETFHSDILNALLDPKGKHLEGGKYLNVFLKFLCSEYRANIDLAHYSDARVAKEEDRIDILIKGSDHAIVIENKINGATDQPRQLPDYLKKVKNKGFTCDAIIYLQLHGNTPPDTSTWTGEERKQLPKILHCISAFDGSDDGTKKDILRGWVEKCRDESKENSDAQHIVRQYAGIIKKLGRNALNRPIMEKFYEEMIKDKGENLKAALSLKKMLDALVVYRAEKIIDKFKGDLSPFCKIENYNNCDAKFSNFRWNDASFGLDIGVESESYSFQFWDTNDREGTKGQAKAMLQKMDRLNEYAAKTSPADAGVFCKEFEFPSQEEDLFRYITDFKKKLGECLPREKKA